MLQKTLPAENLPSPSDLEKTHGCPLVSEQEHTFLYSLTPSQALPPQSPYVQRRLARIINLAWSFALFPEASYRTKGVMAENICVAEHGINMHHAKTPQATPGTWDWCIIPKSFKSPHCCPSPHVPSSIVYNPSLAPTWQRSPVLPLSRTSYQ